jgi:hypothetical protein
MAKPAYEMGHVKALGADYDPATTVLELITIHLSYLPRDTALRVLLAAVQAQKRRDMVAHEQT